MPKKRARKRKGKKKFWIQEALSGKRAKGALHRHLHIAAGEKIPLAKLEKASRAGGKLGKEARLALTLRKLHHGSR